jgi:hypothetical protein
MSYAEYPYAKCLILIDLMPSVSMMSVRLLGVQVLESYAVLVLESYAECPLA